MSADQGYGIFTRERVLTFALAVLTLLALYVCYLIILPFVPALAFALALAVATARPYDWLRARVRSDGAAAAIAVTCVALLIIVPIAFLTTYLVQSAVDNINELRSGTSIAALQAKLESQSVIGPYVRMIEQRLRIQEQIGSLAQMAASKAGGILTGSVGVLTQLVITLFVLFFLFRDRGLALKSLRQMLPLAQGEADRMFRHVGSTIAATVNGSIIVATVQAILAGLIYWILGVPVPVLWAACTFFAAFVPVFGTSLIWVPITLYLLLSGTWVKALILVGWASLAIGSIDNVLYPFLVGEKLRLHTVPTFFAVLGGVGLFGPSGLILGPMTLAITIGLLDVWWWRTEGGHAAEGAVPRKPEEEKAPGSVLQEKGVQSDLRNL